MKEPLTSKRRDDPHYAAVICRDCGQVPLSESQYMRELELPDRGWCCPKCGDSAEFDDSYFEHYHGIDQEPDDNDIAF